MGEDADNNPAAPVPEDGTMSAEAAEAPPILFHSYHNKQITIGMPREGSKLQYKRTKGKK